MWFKANVPGSAYEAGPVDALARWHPHASCLPVSDEQAGSVAGWLEELLEPDLT